MDADHLFGLLFKLLISDLKVNFAILFTRELDSS